MAKTNGIDPKKTHMNPPLNNPQRDSQREEHRGEKERTAIVIDEVLVAQLGRLVSMRVNDQAMQTVLANLRGMIEAFAVLQEFRGEVLMEGASPVVTHPMPYRPDVVQPETDWLSPVVSGRVGGKDGASVVGAVNKESHAQTVDARSMLFQNAPHVVEQYFAVPKVVE